MLDNQLIDIIATQIEQAIANRGWQKGIAVQKNQPRMEGQPSGPTVYFEKLFDQAYGFAAMKTIYVPNPNPGLDTADYFEEREVQWVNTHFQISVIYPQNPEDLSIPTASDAANFVRAWFMARRTIRLFFDQGIGIYRANEVRNPYMENDRSQHEAHPSFDLVLSHQREISFDVPAVHEAVPNETPDTPGSGTYPV